MTLSLEPPAPHLDGRNLLDTVINLVAVQFQFCPTKAWSSGASRAVASRCKTAIRLRPGKGRIGSSHRKTGVRKLSNQIWNKPKTRRRKILPFRNQAGVPMRLNSTIALTEKPHSSAKV